MRHKTGGDEVGIDESFKEMYRKISDCHQNLISEFTELAKKVLAAGTVEELANLYYVAWHMEKLGVDIKKKLKALDAFIARSLVTRWLNSNLNGEPIRTEYATFSPHVVEIPQLPNAKHEPEKYAACLKELGVSDEAIESGTVRIHWPALKEYKEKLDAEGLPLPEAFKGHQHAEFACRVSHKKREILE